MVENYDFTYPERMESFYLTVGEEVPLLGVPNGTQIIVTPDELDMLIYVKEEGDTLLFDQEGTFTVLFNYVDGTSYRWTVYAEHAIESAPPA
jgi:phosphoribosylformylglycinamidine (FGAM) synthase-like amidotransferase family enzyme